MSAGAATAAVIGSFAGVAAVQATPAAAASCDPSDAVVINWSNHFYRSTGDVSTGIGTIYLKSSAKCGREWSYLELKGNLPLGASAFAAYQDDNLQTDCWVAAGSNACSTYDRSAVLGCHHAVAIGYKYPLDNTEWQSDHVLGNC